jgi:hypothetical protein
LWKKLKIIKKCEKGNIFSHPTCRGARTSRKIFFRNKKNVRKIGAAKNASKKIKNCDNKKGLKISSSLCYAQSTGSGSPTIRSFILSHSFTANVVDWG